MRRALGALLAAALVAGVALFVHRPGPVDAQGGGTVEVAVTYNGAPVVEKLKINKDTQQCGTDAEVDRSWSDRTRVSPTPSSPSPPPRARPGW